MYILELKFDHLLLGDNFSIIHGLPLIFRERKEEILSALPLQMTHVMNQKLE